MSITKSTITTYTYNNATRELNIPFDYLRRDFVVVSLGGKGKQQKVLKYGTDYIFTSKTTITILREYQQSEGYDKIIVRRVTDAMNKIINFQDGSILKASELAISQLQPLHVAEEARDLSSYTLFVDDEGNLDARGRKIINLGTPDEGSSDAVNVTFLEGTKDTILGARDETIKAKEEACACAEKAKVSETNAKSSEKSAEQSKQASQSSQEASAKSQQKAAESANNAQRDAASASASRLAAKGSEDSALASAKRAEAAAGRVDGIPKENLKGEFGVDDKFALNQKFLTESFNHVYQAWEQGLTYSKDDLVKGSDNLIYKAYNQTTNEDPTTHPLSWFLVSTVANVKDFGAKGDGVTDDTSAIRNALNNSKRLPTILPRGTYCITDTIILTTCQVLRGEELSSLASNAVTRGTRLKWIGDTSPRKTMIQIGTNIVGAEPSSDASSIKVEGLWLDGDNKVGFLMYGTYLTNDTIIKDVGGQGSIEYNFYFAKAWYATFERIISKACLNNGIAFGMPLEYTDGSKISWDDLHPLEMNQCVIDNIRAANAGMRFVNSAGSYSPDEPITRRYGYGIGAGVGNGFRLNNFLAEGCGGTGVYIYTQAQPSKSIMNGYLEGNCRNSNTSPTSKMVQIIMESASSFGSSDININNIYMKHESGGLLHVLSEGLETTTMTYKLEDLHQPRFLKETKWNGLELPQDTRGDYMKIYNCYYSLGYHNTTLLPFNVQSTLTSDALNVRYSWKYSVPDEPVVCDIYMKSLDVNYTGVGSYSVKDINGRVITSKIMPSKQTLESKGWVRVLKGLKGVKFIEAGTPQGGSNDAKIAIQIRVPRART